jgi:TusA-related sulfurtransferase
MQIDKEIDTRGLNCPLPILKAKKALTDMKSGQLLKVVSTDGGSLRDFQAFAKQTGNELVEQQDRGRRVHPRAASPLNTGTGMTAGEQEPVVLRTAAGDSAAISLHGAQLLSWRPAGAQEQIYRSPLSVPAAGKSVRGGAPICFPQFSDRGPLPKHGFVRTTHWELVEAAMPGGEVAEAHFQVDSSMLPAAWDHAFCLVLVARLGHGWLELHLQAANTGRTPYSFTAALHTYFAVHDVRTPRWRACAASSTRTRCRATH